MQQSFMNMCTFNEESQSLAIGLVFDKNTTHGMLVLGLRSPNAVQSCGISILLHRLALVGMQKFPGI